MLNFTKAPRWFLTRFENRKPGITGRAMLWREYEDIAQCNGLNGSPLWIMLGSNVYDMSDFDFGSYQDGLEVLVSKPGGNPASELFKKDFKIADINHTLKPYKIGNIRPAASCAGVDLPFTNTEVGLHEYLATGMYTIINGNVYDLTKYADFHPGGISILESMAGGQDCTKSFKENHSNCEELLERHEHLKIGRIVREVDNSYILEKSEIRIDNSVYQILPLKATNIDVYEAIVCYGGSDVTQDLAQCDEQDELDALIDLRLMTNLVTAKVVKVANEMPFIAETTLRQCTGESNKDFYREAWTMANGYVYDITSLIHFGPSTYFDMLKVWCGGECRDNAAVDILEDYNDFRIIGRYDDSQSSDATDLVKRPVFPRPQVLRRSQAGQRARGGVRNVFGHLMQVSQDDENDNPGPTGTQPLPLQPTEPDIPQLTLVEPEGNVTDPEYELGDTPPGRPRTGRTTRLTTTSGRHRVDYLWDVQPEPTRLIVPDPSVSWMRNMAREANNQGIPHAMRRARRQTRKRLAEQEKMSYGEYMAMMGRYYTNMADTEMPTNPWPSVLDLNVQTLRKVSSVDAKILRKEKLEWRKKKMRERTELRMAKILEDEEADDLQAQMSRHRISSRIGRGDDEAWCSDDDDARSEVSVVSAASALPDFEKRLDSLLGPAGPATRPRSASPRMTRSYFKSSAAVSQVSPTGDTTWLGGSSLGLRHVPPAPPAPPVLPGVLSNLTVPSTKSRNVTKSPCAYGYVHSHLPPHLSERLRADSQGDFEPGSGNHINITSTRGWVAGPPPAQSMYAEYPHWTEEEFRRMLLDSDDSGAGLDGNHDTSRDQLPLPIRSLPPQFPQLNAAHIAQPTVLQPPAQAPFDASQPLSLGFMDFYSQNTSHGSPNISITSGPSTGYNVRPSSREFPNPAGKDGNRGSQNRGFTSNPWGSNNTTPTSAGFTAPATHHGTSASQNSRSRGAQRPGNIPSSQNLSLRLRAFMNQSSEAENPPAGNTSAPVRRDGVNDESDGSILPQYSARHVTAVSRTPAKLQLELGDAHESSELKLSSRKRSQIRQAMRTRSSAVGRNKSEDATVNDVRDRDEQTSSSKKSVRWDSSIPETEPKSPLLEKSTSTKRKLRHINK
jgi:cytochrome b involved in lipid metabolism